MFTPIRTFLIIAFLVGYFGGTHLRDSFRRFGNDRALSGFSEGGYTFKTICREWNTAQPEGKAIWSAVAEAAKVHNIDQALVLSVIAVESGCRVNARSKRGALGLMQIMPTTAKWLGVKNPKLAKDNVLGGAKYLSMMVEMFRGDIPLALAAYNAGPASVKKHGNVVPPFKETQDYVRKVLIVYKELLNNQQVELNQI